MSQATPKPEHCSGQPLLISQTEKHHRFQSVCSFESFAERTLFTVIGLSSPELRPFGVASEVEGDGQGLNNADYHIIRVVQFLYPLTLTGRCFDNKYKF